MGDIKIISVTKDNAKYFREFDPFGHLKRIAFPKGAAIGAVRDEGSDGCFPAGLMVCGGEEKELMIYWLYVDAPFRYHSIGERLVKAAFDMADENGLDSVTAYFCEEDGRNEICEGQEGYFEGKFLTKKREMPGEWMGPIKNIKDIDYFKEKKNRSVRVEKLLQIDDKKIKLALKALTEDDDSEYIYPPQFEPTYIDRNVSFISYSDEGKISGGIVCIKAGNTLAPVLFCSKDEDEQKTLIGKMLFSALKKYDQEIMIRIMPMGRKYEELINKVTSSGSHRKAYCLSLKQRDEENEDIFAEMF